MSAVDDTDPETRIADALSGITRADAHKAEHVAAGIMRDIGFPSAEVTVSSRDHGIDVRASGALAQVKWQSRPVGRPATQQFAGACLRERTLLRKDSKMLFFAKNGYTVDAVSYADDVRIALFQFDMDGKAMAANKHARDFRKNYPDTVTQEVLPRKKASASKPAGRWVRILEDVALALIIALIVLVPILTVVGAGWLIYLGFAGEWASSSPSGWILLGVEALLVAVIVAFSWWIYRASNPDR
uniref:restriction endonuclease n=1 Tax=Gordonia sp. B7-2 TaxID=3420932 RepID=UPI003D8FFC5C